MRLIVVIVNISVLFAVTSGLFLNPYPQPKYFSDDGDPGEALYLTKYIESGDIETAQQLARVNHPDLHVESYAAYLTVNKTYNSNMFFWFFPAEHDPENAPIILWLQGGPGASGLFGLFYEFGPYDITPNIEAVPRNYSWHLNHNMLYIDNPVGTGFSFTDNDAGYARNEVDVGQNLLLALRQFFLLFPKLQKNDFFVSGESYGGKYVPAIGYAIYQDSKRKSDDPKKPKINLKGLTIGDGWTDPTYQYNYADHLYQLGLIDTNGHTEFVKHQNQILNCIKKRDFVGAFEIADLLLDGLACKCDSLFTNLTGSKHFYDFTKFKNEDYIYAIGIFVQQSKSRRAIHVGNHSYHEMDKKNKVQHYMMNDIMDTVAPWVAELLSHYRILVYTGQLDIIVAYPLTVNYLKHLEFNRADEYKVAKRHIWRVDDEVAGYVKQAGNLTEILVRNSGHLVPTDQPKWAFDMLRRFTHRKDFF